MISSVSALDVHACLPANRVLVASCRRPTCSGASRSSRCRSSSVASGGNAWPTACLIVFNARLDLTPVPQLTGRPPSVIRVCRMASLQQIVVLGANVCFTMLAVSKIAERRRMCPTTMVHWLKPKVRHAETPFFIASTIMSLFSVIRYATQIMGARNYQGIQECLQTCRRHINEFWAKKRVYLDCVPEGHAQIAHDSDSASAADDHVSAVRLSWGAPTLCKGSRWLR
ncbi:unnamed protein product (mitochondrion) [Plasmodiophora brassicae]|uniref:Uncharacterized protein n=1 Tax=Plasmodiophora brassicae TaxID=37360 RepID=A0A0G4J7L1_PLABS|nr:hypothetical protein PBRA_002995 [Plasmodiophora brassicae]SPQ95473.1 unnamed protein product [Plasmodiophora brassicae]